MSIRLKITLLVILTFIAIASIGGYAVMQSRHGAAEVKAVTEGEVPSALASADLVSQLKDVQIASMVLLSATDQQQTAEARDSLVSRQKLLKEALALQQKGASTDAQRGLVDQANESLGNYFDAIDETIKQKASGKNELAQAAFFGNVVQYQAELEKIVETLRIEKNRRKDTAIDTLNANLATTTTTISGATIFTVLLLTASGVLLYRQIASPIARMQATMTDIATNQDFTRRVPVDRMDEVGRSIIAFNGMLERIQESSAQLRQKNADIQAMLQHIPQGILTIIEGGKIHAQYSAYMETLFETSEIAGRDVMEFIFAGATLGADTLSQVEAAIGACIGEDVMNFTFNEHLMVGEIEKTLADGTIKILDLSWSPISDDAGIVTRLMLCIRDVTELRQLAAEASEQKRELEIIGEILAVNQEKFHEFAAGAQQFVEENAAIIARNTEANGFSVNKLFRNMHTIKGNARTYGLLHLANVVHAAEQTYDELRKPENALQWNHATLANELNAVKTLLERYIKINEVSLGRKGPGRRDGSDHYLMIDKRQIQDSLHRLESVNTANLHELVAVRDAVRKTLRLLGTEPIAEILSGVVQSLPALARDLGKVQPIVCIDDGGYVIASQAGGLLKNVFMHLIRNTVDHGIEAPEERLGNGKPAAGTIDLRMCVEAGLLHIALSDDGRGLALHRIRALAVERNLQGSDAAMSDEEIAMHIFRAGFSTAERITDVSGRGVGLDAVRDFIERESGRIAIHFTDDAVGADFRRFCVTVSLPESLAVPLNGDYSAFVAANQDVGAISTASSAPAPHQSQNDNVAAIGDGDAEVA
jgi:two-component system chemotaxis sensor kinase CheA